MIAETAKEVSEFKDSHQDTGEGIYYVSLEKI
jgi:hypothetical protein